MSRLPERTLARKIFLFSTLITSGLFLATHALAQSGGNGIPLPSGPSGGSDVHLRFDDVASSGTIYEAGNCKHSMQPAPGYSCVKFIPGKNGEAIVFGARATAAIPYEIDLEKNPQLTITAWIYQASAGGKGYIVNFYDSRRLPSLKISGGGLAAQAGRTLAHSSAGALPRDQWVFVAGVWDFESRSLRLYQQDKLTQLTGLPMSTDRQDNEVLSPPLFTDPAGGSGERTYVFIGNKDFNNYGWGSDRVAIDDVRIFRRALSTDEINTVRSGGSVAQTDTGFQLDPCRQAPDGPVINTAPSGAPDLGRSNRSNGDTADSTCLPTTGASTDEGGNTGSNNPFDLSKRPATSGIPSSDPILDEARKADAKRRANESGGNTGSNNPFDLSKRPPTSGIPSSDPILDEARKADAKRRANESEQQANESPPVETQARQQGQQARGTPHPVGPAQYSAVAGFKGGIVRTVDLAKGFMEVIYIRDRRDRPCQIAVFGHVGDQVANSQYEFGTSSCRDTLNSLATGLQVVMRDPENRTHIGRLSVCDSRNHRNHRIKGLRIWGDKINVDGSMTYQSNGDSSSRPHCGEWSPSVLCPSNTLATGLVVYAEGRNERNADITGLQLICHAIGME